MYFWIVSYALGSEFSCYRILLFYVSVETLRVLFTFLKLNIVLKSINEIRSIAIY